MKLSPIPFAIRTTWPRQRRLSPLEEAAAEAGRQLVIARMRAAGKLPARATLEAAAA